MTNTSILIVEDEGLIALHLMETLANAGFEVREPVPSGEEALRHVERVPRPDLILLDLKMPRTTGFEVLKWIRGHAELHGLPVIVDAAAQIPPVENLWRFTGEGGLGADLAIFSGGKGLCGPQGSGLLLGLTFFAPQHVPPNGAVFDERADLLVGGGHLGAAAAEPRVPADPRVHRHRRRGRPVPGHDAQEDARRAAQEVGHLPDAHHHELHHPGRAAAALRLSHLRRVRRRQRLPAP